MVKSEKIYSYQSYLEAVTGECYITRGDDDVKFIEDILDLKGLNLKNYSLNELNHIVENKLDVILVECLSINPKTHQIDSICRWFEVPKDFEEEI